MVASNNAITSGNSHVEDDVLALSKDELAHLQTLITSLSKPFGSCSVTLFGKNLCSQSFNASSTRLEVDH